MGSTHLLTPQLNKSKSDSKSASIYRLNSVVSLGSALSGTSKHVLLHNGPDKEALYPFRVTLLLGCLRTRPSREFSLISPNGRCSKTATRFTVIGYLSSVRIFSVFLNELTGETVHIFVHLIFI